MICRIGGLIGTIALLAACANPQPPLGASPAARSSALGAVPATHGCCNIFWNKAHLRLRYPATTYAKAVLSYWGLNGYYTEPVYCKNGGQISATTHRSWGNPQKYLHVVYWFKALTHGPDECVFTAVLNNTGSPPIAGIKLRIQ